MPLVRQVQRNNIAQNDNGSNPQRSAFAYRQQTNAGRNFWRHFHMMSCAKESQVRAHRFEQSDKSHFAPFLRLCNAASASFDYRARYLTINVWSCAVASGCGRRQVNVVCMRFWRRTSGICRGNDAHPAAAVNLFRVPRSCIDGRPLLSFPVLTIESFDSLKSLARKVVLLNLPMDTHNQR